MRSMVRDGYLVTAYAATNQYDGSEGELYEWDDIVERMTGKPLGVDAIKAEFADFEVPV